ncbi:iron-sulfur cluster assembly scaffold protein, partial [Candidatus Pacearchaeota archaeon]|nr:iron-sulfur cluster assembly scaffold protein [Candidatus Pacearchaeota archaeon]
MEYSKILKQHFLNPKNMGKMKNPNATAEVGNPACGDIMHIYLKIDDKTKTIKDIKFETFGCAAAIATSSMLTQIAKKRTLEKAKKITIQDIEKKLGGLPNIKLH